MTWDYLLLVVGLAVWPSLFYLAKKYPSPMPSAEEDLRDFPPM